MGFCFASLGISLNCHVADSTILGRSQFETTLATFELYFRLLDIRGIEFVLGLNLKFENSTVEFKVNFAFKCTAIEFVLGLNLKSSRTQLFDSK